MKSILQSVLLYSATTKMRNLDERSVEILKSYIYVFWLLKFSEHKSDALMDIGLTANDFWRVSLETINETTIGWSRQHTIVLDTLIELFRDVSSDAVKRFASITTVAINLEKALDIISSVHCTQRHVLGNMLTWHVDTDKDAEVSRPEKPIKASGKDFPLTL